MTIREGIGPGSGLWFWDCRVCPCAFGPLRRERGLAEQDGRDHLAGEHAVTAGED
jgi:hypothetical protein